MKTPIIFCGYREWALEIYNYIKHEYEDKIDIKLIKDVKQFEQTDFEAIKPAAMFFIGWSWIIKPQIVNGLLCICLHPSPLPKYRGGSPLQYQIINGEEKSAVTYFKMNEKIDAGDIIWQKELSLKGDLKEIFSRMSETGKEGMSCIINILIQGKSLKLMPQDRTKMTIYKRRTPAQSEIRQEDLKNFTAKELYNKIRALQDPYPNAFFVCKNNTKLYIKQAEFDQNDEE